MEADNNFEKKQNKSKKIIIGIILVVLLIGSFQLGLYYGTRNTILQKAISSESLYLGKVIGLHNTTKPTNVSQDVNFDLFWETWDTLKNNYVDKDKLNDKKIFYGALRGMVAAVGDPYTVFMDPVISQQFNNDLAGTFEGIGAELGIKSDVLTIIAPLPGMPAEKAGLKSGDKIYAINGTSTTGMSIDEAVQQIRGPKGTTVKLSIFRTGFKELKDFVVTRDAITVKSVKTEMRSDKIFVITISSFNNDTSDLFKTAVREAENENAKAIILDLRNNPGGFLESAIDMASEWIEDGVVVSEKYSDGKKDDHLAHGLARLKNIPTVVLVNQGSASASEIVAGALQDDQKATIVGKKSFGKGSVQTMQSLSDGSAIKVTVAKWLTPKGRSISEEGITPDVEVDLTDADYNNSKDPQMIKAVEILLGKKNTDNQTQKK
jgi:carboxyl-terminal processing protease